MGKSIDSRLAFGSHEGYTQQRKWYSGVNKSNMLLWKSSIFNLFRRWKELFYQHQNIYYEQHCKIAIPQVMLWYTYNTDLLKLIFSLF